MLEKLGQISPLTSHVVVFFLGSLTVFLAVGQSATISAGSSHHVVWQQVPVAKLKDFQEGENLILLRQPTAGTGEEACKVDQMVWQMHWDEQRKVPILSGKAPTSHQVHFATAKELLGRYFFSRHATARLLRPCQNKKAAGSLYAAP